MIKVKFYQNGFTASGHAHSNKYGHDLVCAGVSAILMGALNWFNEKSVKIIIDENNITVISPIEDISYYLKLINQQLQAMLPKNELYLSIENNSSIRL